jgi:TatD DNase family protein
VISSGAGLVDTHCHLNLAAFDADREAAIGRARQAGVEAILVPGIDLESSRAAVALAEGHPEVYAAVGVHPHEASTLNASTLAELQALAASPRVVAIGEIGLDFYRDRSPRAAQTSALEAQLDLAARLGLPVSVHCREAMAELLPRLQAWAAQVPAGLAGRVGVLHAYSADRESAIAAIEAGFYIGAAGPLTFPSAADRRAVIGSLPAERLLVETDAPYLAPQAHRGQRNEPAYVTFVADCLSALLAADPASLAAITTDNARRFLGWNHANDGRHVL